MHKEYKNNVKNSYYIKSAKSLKKTLEKNNMILNIFTFDKDIFSNSVDELAADIVIADKIHSNKQIKIDNELKKTLLNLLLLLKLIHYMNIHL